MFIPVMCFCPFLFVFHPVIQFESTRSSSPTECCHFSPWSRKVLVPSLPSATPNTLFHLSTLTDLFLSLFKCMPSLSGSSSHPAPPGWEGGVILKASTSLKFHPHITCLHAVVVVVVWVHVKGLEYVRNVYVGHNHGCPGFSNDRVGFSKLAPVITHDPSVLWFPHCTADSLVFLSLLSFLFLNKYRAWCPSWDRNELQTLPLLFYFPSSRTCSLFLLFPKSLSLSPLIPPLRHSWNRSQNKSAVNGLPLIFFFPSSCEKFPRKPVSFVVGVLSGSHWSAGNREHKGSRVAFKWGWEVVGLWRWEPVETENHSQFHMCLCVGISR